MSNYTRGENPKSLANLKSPAKLPAGIESGPARVRCEVEALRWWQSLGTAGRGELVEQLHRRTVSGEV